MDLVRQAVPFGSEGWGALNLPHSDRVINGHLVDTGTAGHAD
jgi:hypothetical protein